MGMVRIKAERLLRVTKKKRRSPVVNSVALKLPFLLRASQRLAFTKTRGRAEEICFGHI
jgi:hypothetical protein